MLWLPVVQELGKIGVTLVNYQVARQTGKRDGMGILHSPVVSLPLDLCLTPLTALPSASATSSSSTP